MQRFLRKFSSLTPVQVLAGSFLLLIAIGTIILMLPVCHIEGHPVSFLDCLFTSTSAVCVTGLIVVDTATDWSRTGQIVILILLQLGGIGIVTFGALFFLLLGQKINFRQRQLLKEQYGEATFVNVFNIIPVVAGTTLVIELLGVLLLIPTFVPKYGPAEGTWHSIFHAISAFCNAGFSTFSDSLVQIRGDLYPNLVICGLIVLGGLGFPVIAELISKREKRRRFSLHTRVVLFSSAILIAAGAVIFYFVEAGSTESFRNMGFSERILSSLFQSVTARTAGFNTVDIGSLAPATVFVLQFLMIVGGSPSGTAGGIKTTTFVACLAGAKSVLSGLTDTKLFDRRLERNTARRALVLLVLVVLVIALALFLMLLTGNPETRSGPCGDFLRLSFETVSAFGTVGLSTGITSSLSVGQKIVIIFVMFIGRLGPMTFALALAKPKSLEVRYPECDLLTG